MSETQGIPDYLREVYAWAYLDPRNSRWLDRQAIVEVILWGNAGRLASQVLAEIRPGTRVLQLAAVYGNFSCRLARQVGADGELVVADIAPRQVDLTRRKLAGIDGARVERRDACEADPAAYDAVVCFFLLHEVPDDVKRRVVGAALASVAAGGKAIFVDYHRPRAWHPARPVVSAVFALLEPFARTLWQREIADFAGVVGDGYRWTQRTLFGDLYQVVVAQAVGDQASGARR